MVNITLSLPEDLRKEMKKHKEVNWSAVIRRALVEQLRKIAIAEEIASKSKFTKKDVEELSKKIKKEMAKKHNLED